MTGKFENTVHFTMADIKRGVARGDDQTDHDINHEEAMHRRAADPEAPLPYDGWQDSVIKGLPKPKKQLTLRLDAEVVQWFKAQGKGYQTLMNAVLKGYVDHKRRTG